MVVVGDTSREKKSLFLIRYSLQAVLYEVWRVRNKVRHGDKLLPLLVIKRMLDKEIRNKISVMRKKGLKGMEDLMQL